MMKTQDIELLAGISLSDGGISLPLHTVLRKRPFRITMKTPTTRSLIRISKRYLRIGVTPEEYDAYNLDQRIRFVFLHGKDISRIVAYGIVRGPVLGRVLNRMVAWMLRELMTPDELASAWRQILSSTSTTSFGIIIASAAALNKMQPLASRNESANDKRS
mgnify:FL=1|jgi:hypothetical protein